MTNCLRNWGAPRRNAYLKALRKSESEGMGTLSNMNLMRKGTRILFTEGGEERLRASEGGMKKKMSQKKKENNGRQRKQVPRKVCGRTQTVGGEGNERCMDSAFSEQRIVAEGRKRKTHVRRLQARRDEGCGDRCRFRLPNKGNSPKELKKP